MAFDPDAYLANKSAPASPQAFNPDAYLAAKPPSVPRETSDGLQTTIDALRGFRDIPQAGSQMLLHALPESVVQKGNELIGKVNQMPIIGPATQAMGIIPDAPSGYDKEIQSEEQAYQQRRAQAGETGIDGTRIAGNILATAPVAQILPGAQGKLLAATGKAAVQGGVLGALQPVVDGGENFVEEKTKQVGIGAVTAGVLTPLARGFARVLSPNVSRDVQKMLDEGVTPTPGQILGGGAARAEEKLTSVPLLGDAIKSGQRRAINEFNRAAYRRALDPIGKSTNEIGRDGIASVRQQLGQAYDDLLPKIQFKPDAEFVADISKIEQMAANMPEQQANQFRKIIEAKLQSRLTPQGNMTGETLKGVESELTRLAKGYKTDASFDNRELGDALGEVLASLRRTTERVNPEYAKDLKAINLGWANYARLRRAASGVGAENGLFTPAQLQSAVKAEGMKGSKSAFSEGAALMQDLSEAGKNVLAQKVPNSGTADRLMQSGIAGLLAAGAGAVPSLGYTPLGQRMLAAALTSRPAIAKSASQLLTQSSPALSAAGAAASNPLINSR